MAIESQAEFWTALVECTTGEWPGSYPFNKKALALIAERDAAIRAEARQAALVEAAEAVFALTLRSDKVYTSVDCHERIRQLMRSEAAK